MTCFVSLVNLGVAALCLANLAASVHNGCMVPAANFLKPCNEKKLKSSDFFLDFTGPTDIMIITILMFKRSGDEDHTCLSATKIIFDSTSVS